MGRVFWLQIIALALASHPLVAWAYVQTVTPEGTPVRWSSGFKFNLAGNPRNQSGLGDQEVYSAVTRCLQRWKSASSGSVEFDYWQGSDPGIYEPDSDYNGLSSFYFASSARGDPGVSSNVLGLTQVWYNADTGQILESDTVLNDRDFIFTTNPHDTSGYGAGSGSYSSGMSRVYIENVLTHELGHAFGLSHSAGLQSTMLFMESPEQAHLGCDEQVGIHALYPAGDSGSRGWLSGAVRDPSGNPVFGAHILAISRTRGVVLSTGITDRGGNYQIGGLEAGLYYLAAEPYFAGSSALPGYYEGISDDVCGAGHPFRRTILTDATGYLAIPVNVPAGGAVQAPPLSVHCQPLGDAVSSSRSSSSITSAPSVNAGDPNGFGFVDRFTAAHQTFYRLTGIGGHVEIHGLAYSLYSPVHATLSLLNSSGNPVSAQALEEVYQGDSGFVDYDSSLVADDLPHGDYVLKVSVSTIGVSYYPAGPVMLDTDPFLLVTGSINAPSPPLAAALAINARCRMDEHFASYQSPPGNPPRGSVDDGDHVGFCGTIDPSSGGGGGPGPGEILGWLLPWCAMVAGGRIMLRATRATGKRRPVLASDPLHS